ncbi:MAG: T9SS type A sorting domain-containing protein [Flavobacteriales bacterium]|nr:T9SS type A sorting domain-containing protein [Flavobacteriales bacterium]MCB9194367.1 T9SS type A sorting domain-containing protein [Flavobacteriales bacterium]
MRKHTFLIALWSLGHGLVLSAQAPFTLRQTPGQPLSTYYQCAIPLPNGDIWWVFGTWDASTSPWLSRVHLRRSDGTGQTLATNDVLLPAVSPAWQVRGAAAFPGGGIGLVGAGAWVGMELDFDAGATLLDARTFDFGTATSFDDVRALANGECMIVGYSDSYPLQMHVDAQGDLISAWSDRFGNDKGAHHLLRASNDGGMLIVGQELTQQGPGSLYVIKQDTAANVQWAERFDGPAATALDAVQRANGGWAVTSVKQIGPAPLHAGPWLLLLDPSGLYTHQGRFWPGPYEDSYGYASGLTEDANGHVLLTGQCNPGGTFLIDAGTTATADSVRWLPGTGGTSSMHGTVLSNGDLLLDHLEYDTLLARNIPVMMRWDPATLHPCGEHRDTLFTDTLAFTLTTGVVRTPISGTTADLLPQIVPDTIPWTSDAPCMDTAIPEPHVVHTIAPAIFPNPADAWVQVSGMVDAQRMDLIDADGRTVGSWRAPLPTVLSVSALPGGMYAVRTVHDHQVRNVRLMVVH